MPHLLKALFAAPVAALAGALCDLALGRGALGGLEGAVSWGWWGVHLLSAHLVLAFSLAALLGAVAESWRRIDGPPPCSPAQAAAAWATAGVVLAVAGVLGGLGSGVVRGMANPLLAAVATGLLVAGATVGSALAVGPGAWRMSRRFLGRRAAPMKTLGAIVAACAGAALAGLAPRVEWGALPLGVAVAPCVTAATLLGVARRPPPAGLAAFAALLGVVGMGQALVGFPGDPAAGAALLDGPPLAGRMVLAGRSMLDRDGDGYSALLGGGDCDDTAPDVGPAAEEVPGNGVDDDCVDGDAPPAVPSPPSPPVAPLEPPPAAAGARPPNILFILVDTLRADHLGSWGYHRPTSPHMDRLAGESVRFARAYAQSPHTPRSIPSIFTSRLPSRIAFDGPRRSYPRLRDEAHTLAEVLRDAGYATVGVFSHFYWSAKRNVLQGFDVVDNADAKDLKGSNRDIAAPRIFKRFEAHLADLQERGAPWFLFVHYFEPHSTYLRHPPPHDFGKGWMDKYDSEIHFVDEWVGRTLGALEATPAADNTVIVLTSDHGEGNGEHGFKWHGQHLYDEVLHVPLLVKRPGGSPASVEGPVALMDVAPTLIELAGGAPPPAFEGRSLVGALAGGTPPSGPVRAELVSYPGWKESVSAVVDFPFKLLRNKTKNTWELFDLAADPREGKNLYRKRPEVAKRMRGLLAHRPAAATP